MKEAEIDEFMKFLMTSKYEKQIMRIVLKAYDDWVDQTVSPKATRSETEKV